MQVDAKQSSLAASIYTFARSAFLNLRSMLAFPYGVVYFHLTGKTPNIAHQAMIWLFCSTRGRFSDWVSYVIAKCCPKLTLPVRSGVLGDMGDTQQLNAVVANLRKNGYFVFPAALPQDVCDRLMNITHRNPALVRRMDGQDTDLHLGSVIFTGCNPTAVRYDYDPSDLLDHADVQSLLADGSLLSVVQEYLGCAPIADVLSMWWHTNFHDRPDSEAAQFFHFDMDRFKWVKIFIYLTDVSPDNGPHAFVEGSHATGGIPSSILSRGYKRITDEEVAQTYPAERVRSFTAPRGSIIIEDTRGLHKGVHVSGDPRLILQLQFSNSLFGTNYPKASFSKIAAESLKDIMKSSPQIYRQYL